MIVQPNPPYIQIDIYIYDYHTTSTDKAFTFPSISAVNDEKH